MQPTLSENARYAFGYAVSIASQHNAKIRGESLQVSKYYSLNTDFRASFNRHNDIRFSV